LIAVLDILAAEFLDEFNHSRIQLLSLDGMFHMHFPVLSNKALTIDCKTIYTPSPAPANRELPELAIIATIVPGLRPRRLYYKACHNLIGCNKLRSSM
jgi:hypothetical protein